MKLSQIIAQMETNKGTAVTLSGGVLDVEFPSTDNQEEFTAWLDANWISWAVSSPGVAVYV